jgi:Raf kinase inhibitor-like YbhB/YbcL family protein
MATSPAPLKVDSQVVQEGKPIPPSAVHDSAGGQNISPDLSWGALPPGTRSLAVTCYDPDAPTTVGFTHWVLFNLSPELRALPAGAGAPGKAPKGAVLGFTDYGASEYGGMAPPPGDPPHRYQFTVYALDVPRLEGADASTTYAKFRFLIRGHVLAQGTLTGLFERKG